MTTPDGPQTTLLRGELEIDHQRGVIYFHAKSGRGTVLRIGGLPKPIPDDVLMGRMLDVLITGSHNKDAEHDPEKHAKDCRVVCDWKGH